MNKFFLILNSLFLFASSLSAATITGTVTDSTTGDLLPGANIIIVGTSFGTSSDLKGNYIINNVPAGEYEISVSYIGYKQNTKKIKVQSKQTLTVNFIMESAPIIGETVTVTAQAVGQAAAINQQLSSSKSINVVSSSRIQELPDANAAESLGRLPGVSISGRVGEGGKVIVGGLNGKVNNVAVDGIIMPGEAPVQHNTEEYDRIIENDFLKSLTNPLSTFAVDVDAASYANTRRFIMQDQLPHSDVIRTEEFINYFQYEYKEPREHPLSINTEYGECPWNENHQLIHIGLQGKRIKAEDQKPSNLVFLLDVSGSMNGPKKLPLVKKAMTMLIQNLKDDDRISIVVYASATGLVLQSTPGSEKQKIFSAINALSAGGSTAGGAGIKLAYKVARKNFIEGGNNRVILCTDGDFNVGISSTSELVKFVEKQKDENIFITICGFGMGNYKDHRLQEIADRGNGTHAYIDNIMEAKKMFVHELSATLFTIAKDVKIQVEFNPAHIDSFRLIGYENRLLKKEDFDDDKKDAGEIGAGHTVTALYEVVPVKAVQVSDDLKYQKTQIKQSALKSDEVITINIRYKDPNGEKSKKFSKVLKGKPKPLQKTTNNFKFSAAVAEFSLILRDSKFKGNASLDQTEQLAKQGKGEDAYGYRTEFIGLVNRVKLIKASEVQN